MNPILVILITVGIPATLVAAMWLIHRLVLLSLLKDSMERE